ncbi:MAG: histidine phosphatase family protein [Deltaproteobacteria bacterium]
MIKRMYIFRHGETEYNRMKMMQGRSIDSVLNDNGHLQVNRFFDYYKDIPFDVVYSSELKRSIQSILKFKELNIPHIIDPRITEVSWGINEGKFLDDEVMERFRIMIYEWKKGNHDYSIPGGESANSLKSRIESFIADIKESKQKNILVNTHGRALRMLIARMLGEPVEAMEKYEHHNTGMYLMEYDGYGFTMLKENDTTHLN